MTTTAASTTPTQGARNGTGTAALVFGILALISCWTLVGGIVLGIVAIILGILGRRRVSRNEASNGGAATAGLTLGVVGLVIAVVFIAVGATFLFHHKKQINDLENCLKTATTQAQKDSCNQRFSSEVNSNG